MSKEIFCEVCGKQLIPAPARFDGEATFVGYLPHDCQPAPQVNKAQEEIIKLKNLLVKYEEWEAMIVSEDKMWWPRAAKDVMTNEIYEKMLELQTGRNELLKRFTPQSYSAASPPDAGKEAVGFCSWVREQLNNEDLLEEYTTSELYTLYKQNK